jgi:membrane protease YdiL (CAAX protease family)
MISSLAAADAIAPANVRTEMPAVERRRCWFEVCLVLAVAFGTFIVNALYFLKNGPQAVPHYNLRWAVGVVQETTSLLLLVYVLSRRGLGFRHIGLRWSVRDCLVGLLIAGLAYIAYLVAAVVIQMLHYSLYGSVAIGRTAADFFAHPSVAAIPFHLLNPLFEELIVRAYLMTEIVELTGSSLLAVLISVAVQFSYHLYYGWTGAIAISFCFLTFAVYYARSRKALPVIVAHEIFDIYALVRVW